MNENKQPIRLYNIYGDDKGKSFAGNVWEKEGISPTLTTSQGGNRQPMIEEFIAIKNANAKGYEEAYEGDSIHLFYPNSKTRRGRVGHDVAQTLQARDEVGVVVKMQYDPGELKHENKRLQKLINNTEFKEGVPMSLDTYDQVTNEEIQPCLMEPNHSKHFVFNGLRIRKLTPREYWRLMGFSDENFDKAQSTGNSNTQLYKQAGNSIVVNVLKSIFEELL